MLRCRLCYSDANPELCENIFNEKLAPPIWRIIAELTQLIIMRDDPYTKIVCLECFDQLKKCDIFRKMILHTDWRIRHETCNYHDNNSIETKTETITIDTEQLVENIRNNFNDFNDCVAIKTEIIEEDAGSTNDNECSQDNSCNETVDDDNSITNDRDEGGNHREGEYSDKTDNRSDIDQNVGKTCTETQMKSDDNKSGSNKSTHQCDQCDKTFSTKTNLMFHLKVHKNNDNATDQSSSQDDTNCNKSPTDDNPTEQLNPKDHHCNICKKTFSSKSSLKIHSRVHTGEKPYHCNNCDAKFSLQGNLQTHQRVHTGEKPYHCENCNVRFSHLVQLQRHQSVHTGEKPYHCHICDKRFRVKHNLTEHLNIHSGEKPYRCEICNKGFAQTCNLRRHLMTHTGERPFPCDVCGKRFAVRQHLNDHFKIHTGEKPYHCDSCEKRYSTKSHLRRHLKVHVLHN